MSRPIDHEKRLEIALGALEVLRERGLIGTSMSQIAAALGMKRPTLYHYFPDLRSMFETAVAHIRDQEARYVAPRLMGMTHPVDLLDAFVRAEHAFYREEGYADFLVLVLQFWASGTQQDRARFEELTTQQLQPLRAMLVHGLQLAIDEGTLRPTDPEVLVDFVFALMDGAMVHHILRGTDPEPLSDLLRDRVLDPLRLP